MGEPQCRRDLWPSPMSFIQQGSSKISAGTATLTQRKLRDAWRQPVPSREECGFSLCHTYLLPQALRKDYQVHLKGCSQGLSCKYLLNVAIKTQSSFLTSGSISGFSLQSDGFPFPLPSLLPCSKQVVITLSCLDSATKINKGFLSQKSRLLTFKFNVQWGSSANVLSVREIVKRRLETICHNGVRWGLSGLCGWSARASSRKRWIWCLGHIGPGPLFITWKPMFSLKTSFQNKNTATHHVIFNMYT